MRRIGNDGDARAAMEMREIIEDMKRKNDARMDEVDKKIAKVETVLAGISANISLAQKNVEDVASTHKVDRERSRDDRVIIVSSIFIAGIMHPYASFIIAGVVLGIIIIQTVMSRRG